MDAEDLLNPELNIRYGSWYLRHLLDKYGDEELALAAYNAGQTNVDRWRERGVGIQFPETRHYVERVRSSRRCTRGPTQTSSTCRRTETQTTRGRAAYIGVFESREGRGLMHHRTAAFLTVLAAVLLLVAGAATAAPPAYDFDVVADTAADRFASFDGCPALNNEGWVAFAATRRNGTSGIWRANGRRIVNIAREDGIDFFGRNPSINDSREVSFAAGLEDGGEMIAKGRGGPLTIIAQTEPGPFNFFGFNTSINNAGDVAFKAELDNFDEGLFVGNGGPVRTIYLASTSPFQGSDEGPSMNDLGQIAYFEFLDSGGSGIFRTRGGSAGFVTIVDERTGSADDPSLNNHGVVAFLIFLNDGGEAIMTGSGGPLTTIVDSSGPFSFFGPPSLNDDGDVAFSAVLDDSFEQGIFDRSRSGRRPCDRHGGRARRLDRHQSRALPRGPELERSARLPRRARGRAHRARARHAGGSVCDRAGVGRVARQRGRARGFRATGSAPMRRARRPLIAWPIRVSSTYARL